jgi:ubiquinone biosynthesis monooxygenase Coq7
MTQPPDHSSTRTIARILKVNHAGEYGAIRIYRAQIWMAKRFYPDLVAFLEETLTHEIRHASLFLNAMPPRSARPCRIMALWGNGGFVLGFGTALLGRQGVWICTAAVEGAVHRHLEDQLGFLRERDAELHSLIDSIKAEELGHLHHAEERITTRAAWARVLHCAISGATDAVIWLSTWGDSTRMARELAAAKGADQ